MASPRRRLNGVGVGTAIEDQTGRGVFLSWQDILVTVAVEKGRRKVIIDRITGFARPGQVLALMGPSGSGKTTLLDTLSGKMDTIFHNSITKDITSHL